MRRKHARKRAWGKQTCHTWCGPWVPAGLHWRWMGIGAAVGGERLRKRRRGRANRAYAWSARRARRDACTHRLRRLSRIALPQNTRKRAESSSPSNNLPPCAIPPAPPHQTAVVLIKPPPPPRLIADFQNVHVSPQKPATASPPRWSHPRPRR